MFDIVTVCAGADLKNILLCIQGLKRNLIFNKLYVITNQPDLVPIDDQVVAIHEKELISSKTIDRLRNIDLPFFPKRFGWYLQQFLKMEFSRSKFCKKDYLIWDADTILLQPISFKKGNRVIFSKGSEKLNYHYIHNFKRLLKLEPIFNNSMISQHLFVDKNVMVELMETTENNFNIDFVSAVMNNLEGDTPSLFSEYETYCNFYANKYPDKYFLVERNWFRNAAAVVGFTPAFSTLKIMFSKCEYIALEKFDCNKMGQFKGLLKFLLYKIKPNILYRR
jgi:hypothetical protein